MLQQTNQSIDHWYSHFINGMIIQKDIQESN